LEEGYLMLMKQKNRNATSRDQGCGGRYCVCCDDSRKYNKKNRRAIRRIEKRNWKKEL
jgi:hypothetical protein